MEGKVTGRRWLASGGSVFAVVIAALALTPAVGAAQSAASDDVTFTKDVAPILYNSCVVCHRAGEMAPMALTTYAEVRPWARSIKNRVIAREMPPLAHRQEHRDPGVQGRHFAERRADRDDRDLGGRRGAHGRPG